VNRQVVARVFDRHVGEEDQATHHGDVNSRGAGRSVHETNVGFAGCRGAGIVHQHQGLNVRQLTNCDDVVRIRLLKRQGCGRISNG